MRDQDMIEEPATVGCPSLGLKKLPSGFDGVEPGEHCRRMREYPEGSTLAWSVIEALFFSMLGILIGAILVNFTSISPEEAAALEAEGAAAFDAKVEAAGGWDAWLSNELAKVEVSK